MSSDASKVYRPTSAAGGLIFGPRSPEQERDYFRGLADGVTAKSVPNSMGCNCLGPQPGQTKCPCALAAEMAQGRRMIEEGVTINGKRYRLVPE